ncbi:MAG: dipeptide/oligopeptide/nickel ABC transporter permease/ATP-binding protein, partial [Kiloniellales bacterium]|nr:dipeptide/oligopeptide/nickel ABC transporter permease/ATP-binding protein [Kiloniellales bacterium]
VSLVRREFIDAARLAGYSNARIIASELFPNVLPVIVIATSTTIGWMILETAGLSFLGLGAQPPQADLGSMLGEGRRQLFTAPHVSIIPGLMIFALVMSINLMGDGVRDVLDPRLKSGALGRPSARTEVAGNRAKETATAGETAEAATEAETVLDVRGLATEFRVGAEVYRAVGGVDFALRAEECLGLVGESGSGKSVTAMSLLGLVPTPPGRIVGGRVAYRDQDLLDVSYARLRQLRGGTFACVFQDPLSTLHPLFTVGDQIVEVIRAHQPLGHAKAHAMAVELLKLVHMPNAERRMDAYPHELSGGMRQRVCIAMALANDPEILIADEPTTALDVTVQAQMLKLLNRLRADRKATVLFITHDFGVVSEICDRVAVMYAGRIVEIGPAEAVLAEPAHPYTRKLIDCVPVLGESRRRLDAIPGLPPPVNRLPAGCAFAERCPRARAECRADDVALAPLGDGRSVRCLFPLVSGGAELG